jgi:hypothetical protein
MKQELEDPDGRGGGGGPKYFGDRSVSVRHCPRQTNKTLCVNLIRVLVLYDTAKSGRRVPTIGRNIPLPSSPS